MGSTGHWLFAPNEAGGGGSSTTQVLSPNYAQNAEFRYWQRQVPGTPTNVQDAAYGPDRWYILTSGGATNVAVSRDTSCPTTSYSTYSGLFTQGDASARQFGIMQYLESTRCLPLRGQAVSMSFWAKTNGTDITTVRAGIVEWTGTADAPTRDIVSSWAATPTLVATTAFANTPSDLTTSSTWTQFTVTATLGTTFTNLGIFIWTPNAEAQNDDLFITQVQLVAGSTAIAWNAVSLSPAADLNECQRFYEKSFAIDAITGGGSNVVSVLGIANATTSVIMVPMWHVRKFKQAVTVVVYDQANAANNIDPGSIAIDSYSATTDFALFYVVNNGGGFTAGTMYYGNFTAESEF